MLLYALVINAKSPASTDLQGFAFFAFHFSGERGIRTPGTVTRTSV